ncbi:Uncharacterised protein [Cedecea neteri]|uniref:Uncharacterized protein n=1 Tax=Cedecea neteri TaxID=158822 RepID=A0A291E3J2_9ENTR|nr:hypothetical protein [Cedecea neteri]ATF94492.1 hypothetical protein CO704_21535 [Cedecea neteri]SQA97918.1 Uncharacterised protein [Cedecea neteri]
MPWQTENRLNRGNICVRTSSWCFEQGATELARQYFIAADKTLCIVDADAFGSEVHLLRYLAFIRDFKPDLLVMIAGAIALHFPDANNNGCSVTADAPITCWRETLDALNFMGPNIDNIIAFLTNRRFCR